MAQVTRPCCGSATNAQHAPGCKLIEAQRIARLRSDAYEQDAYEHLIAAAPALLEACRVGEKFTRRFAAIQQATGVNTAPVESALGQLRAAIALATEGGGA